MLMRVHEIGKIAYISAIVAALTLCAIATYVATPRTVVIKRTDKGFAPSTVLVRKHDSVRFVNETREPIHIESDRFVSALIYPGAVVVDPIEPGRSWSFTFDEAGVWAFHDTDRLAYKGEVLVNGMPGEASSNCLKKAGDTLSAYCWEPEIRSLIDSKGLDAAFNFFAEEYAADDAFKENCHDITHVLGAAAYDDFRGDTSVVSRQETSYCGFGFYHGFIQVALDGEGAEGLRAVRSYCEALERSDRFNSENAAYLAASACYHGIGHAVFDLIDESYWGDGARMVAKSLSTCESALNDEHARYMCSTGVFNSLANALSARTYKLSFGHPDLFAVCKDTKTAYKDDCYAELGLGYVRENSLTTEAGLRFFQSFEYASGTAAAITGLVDDDLRRSISSFDPAEYLRLCASFSQSRYTNACLLGVSVGLSAQAQVSHEYSPMISFCQGLQEGSKERSRCLDYMFARIRGIATPQDLPDLCMRISAQERKTACPYRPSM